MPLILLTGFPSSGKSRRAVEIKKYFEEVHGKTVHLVSENELISDMKISKTSFYSESDNEKQVRSQMRSEAQRNLTSNVIVILDSGNYIKGYRYELYCISKAAKTTHCIVECDSSTDSAWKLNIDRNDEKYTKDVFDALVLRYETPSCWNRWDKPLITVQLNDQLPGDKIYAAIYNRPPPRQNISTQSIPLSTNDRVFELNKVLQEVINVFEKLISLGTTGENIELDNFSGCVISSLDSSLSLSQLEKYRTQFLALNKLRPLVGSREDIAAAFVQFINSNMHHYERTLFN